MAGETYSRREFVALAAGAAVGLSSGCATNPVTGRQQFMLVSEDSEVDMDRKAAPHQFSSDYGPVQDASVNAYVSEVGSRLAANSHRPTMPYSFRVLNSVVVNGYTFPGGSVGLDRGLMLAMENEAELAAVLGHELGHVSARHAAERMSKSMVASVVVAGLTLAVQSEGREYAALAAGLGGLGANALLCRYSRDDERQADALGMEYMTRTSYSPDGMVQLMDIFMNLHNTRPSSVDLLFATHPMSEERHETARRLAAAQYASARGRADNRERYMDRIASIRKMRGAIEDMQQGEALMMQNKLVDAEASLKTALQQAPDDYAGLLLMAKCCMAQNRKPEAMAYAEKAKAVYPSEAQALHVSGMTKMAMGRYDSALSDFSAYERALPGNPNSAFFSGQCLEQMGRRQQAAAEYQRYLRSGPSGSYATYAQNRMVEWGYVRPPQQTR